MQRRQLFPPGVVVVVVLAAVLVGQLACVVCAGPTVSIVEHGAVAGVDTAAQGKANSKAIFDAVMAANATSSQGKPTTVLVPPDLTFTVLNSEAFMHVSDVTLQIDGTLLLSNDISAWPKRSDVPVTLAALYFGRSQRITVQGKGLVEGQGYLWWWTAIITGKDERPMLLATESCEDLLIQQVTWQNAPYYHINPRDSLNLVVRDLTIYVSVEEQAKLHRATGNWRKLSPDAVSARRNRWRNKLLTEGSFSRFSALPSEEFLSGVPIYPLNTDGIDPSGENILIENVDITNYDDAVAVKPQHGGGFLTQCSQNIVINNMRVHFSVGSTIGSVPPNDKVNCVRNVTFSNIVMFEPFKAIYVKPNPGDHGTGIIDSILYRNLTAVGSLWYPIWCSTQQQDQPGGGADTQCSFLFPKEGTCPTQPRVPITNLSLQDITLTEGITLPGVLMCNSTNPCTGWSFQNVVNTPGETGWEWQDSYWCQNIVHSTSKGNKPDIPCF